MKSPFFVCVKIKMVAYFFNFKKFPLLLEVIPPSKKISKKDFNLFLARISKICQKKPITAIDIPDLTEEKRIKRKIPLEKMTAWDFALLVKKKIRIPVIVNRITVFENLKKQRKWLLKVWNEYKIRALVLVGAPSDKNYPGLSVIQMANLINQLNQKKLTHFYYGAITIPHRKKEVEKIIAKQKAGVKFFLSQIIVEPKKTCQLLKKYYLACQKENLKPVRFFLSFAPFANWEDWLFLKSLGLFIPPAFKKTLLTEKKSLSKFSLFLAEETFRKILNFCQKNKIQIPLGINICYLKKKNLGLTEKLITCLTHHSLKQTCQSSTHLL